MNQVHAVNKTMEIKDCKGKWSYNEKYDCCCLEDVVYTPSPSAVQFQRLSIFVPGCYMNPDGTLREGTCGIYHTRTAPVIFENNASGYAQMEHTWLDGPRNYAGQYLKRGMIYVTCGCRGRQTMDSEGRFIGKAPASLVDFKTAVRFLRHNKEALPGNMEHIISVGWSAGGAMSALLGCTGNNESFQMALRENGAFMEEGDEVYAAQVYCPIIDLEHADMAYEWQFAGQYDYGATPFFPAGEMNDFQKALSKRLAADFISYFNGLGLKCPKTGAALLLGEDGRSGSAYEFLMEALEESAAVFLNKLEHGALGENYSLEEYLDGDYSYKTVDVEKLMELIRSQEAAEKRELSSGEEEEYEGFGQRITMPQPPQKTMQGDAKREWLGWDGQRADIKSLDAFQKEHRRRMKGCPSFDLLDLTSGENQLFGSESVDVKHFSQAVARAVASLRESFPEECERYEKAFAAVGQDEKQKRQIYLTNPLNFIGTEEKSDLARYFRIHVGACDADTSFLVSMILAVKLWNTRQTHVIYSLIWDQPHSEADYEGEVCDWIEGICR